MSNSRGLVEWFSGLASLEHRLPNGQAGRQAIFFMANSEISVEQTVCEGKWNSTNFCLSWNEQCNAAMAMALQNMEVYFYQLYYGLSVLEFSFTFKFWYKVCCYCNKHLLNQVFLYKYCRISWSMLHIIN